MGGRAVSETTTKPASSGICGVVGCSNVADFETQRRTGPSTWTVRLDCLDHIPTAILADALS